MLDVLKFLLAHKDEVKQVLALLENIRETVELHQRVKDATEILRILSTLSPTEVDDQVVAFLKTIEDTEFFLKLVDLIAKRMNPDEELFGAETISPEELGEEHGSPLVWIEVVTLVLQILKALRK